MSCSCLPCTLPAGSRTCHLWWHTRYVLIGQTFLFFWRMPDVYSCCLFTMKKLGSNFIWFPCCLPLHFSAICLLSSLSSSEEIEKKLTAYRKGCKIWNMLIFCQVWKNMCVIICISCFFTSVHVEYLWTCYFALRNWLSVFSREVQVISTYWKTKWPHLLK